MAIFDHWNPILLSEDLKSSPVAAMLAGQRLVLFRTRAGIGVLDDLCPHRRMRLSCGQILDGKLQCKYHGWTFDAAGAGESPGTPRLHAHVGSYEAREELGAIWVKARTSETQFPSSFVRDDMVLMCRLRHTVPAPLELVMDNFCEIEHTPTTHQVFGYPLDRMHEVALRVEADEHTTRVAVTGPSRPMPLWMQGLLGVDRSYNFNDNWTSYFSPCYGVYDHWFSHPETGKEGWVHWRNVHFFWPIDDKTTGLTTWNFGRVQLAGGRLSFILRLFAPLMRRVLNREIEFDVNILASLGSLDPSMDGMKLSRFDKVLSLNRERIARLYRGRHVDSSEAPALLCESHTCGS